MGIRTGRSANWSGDGPGSFAGVLLASLLPGQAAAAANAKPKTRKCKKDGQCRDGQVCTNGACATTCNQFTGAPCAGGCRCNFPRKSLRGGDQATLGVSVTV